MVVAPGTRVRQWGWFAKPQHQEPRPCLKTNARTESHRGDNTRSESSRPEQVRGEKATGHATAEFADMGASSVKAGLRMQRELFDTFQDIGRDWLVRGTSQAELAFKLPNKLTTARSPADAFSAYHEWLSEWLSLCGEGRPRFITDSQKLVDTGVRCFATVSPAMTS